MLLSLDRLVKYSIVSAKLETDPGCICTQYLQNIFQNIKKIEKKIRMQRDMSYVNLKFHIKPIIFVPCEKKNLEK
jgi:hypothetical protein